MSAMGETIRDPATGIVYPRQLERQMFGGFDVWDKRAVYLRRRMVQQQVLEAKRAEREIYWDEPPP